MKFESFGLSDIGPVRPNNEDVWAAKPEIGFFALADGMGGHQAGETAAKETIDSLTNKIAQIIRAEHSSDSIARRLKEAIELSNQWVYRMSREYRAFAGMGTTLCCLCWTQEAVIYAHVGDSRVYRLRKDRLERLTEDHSLLAKWEAMGKKAQECETPYPYKNVITRAIGTQPKANPEVAISPYEPGDLYFLCSDGLTDVLSDEEIKEILLQSPSLEKAAIELIQMAKIKGSHDNITVLMIQREDKNGENLFRQQLDNGSRSEGARGDVGRSERTSS